MKRLLLALALLLISSGAFAQCNGVFANGTVCGNNTGTSNTPRAVSPASLLGAAGGANGQTQYNNSGVLGGYTPNGDCTVVTATGVFTCLKTNGVSFGPFATANATTATAALNVFTSTLQGVAPASGGGTANFLRADSTFAVPPGTGVTSVTCGTGLSGGTITTTGTCAVSLTTATNVLGADVLLNNTANYFDGPSMAQGTSGTWWVSGAVTVTDPTSAQIHCKLWDGTTVISSSSVTVGAGFEGSISLSGFLVSPAANIKISCKDITTTGGKIQFNLTGSSKDSTIFGQRIN